MCVIVRVCKCVRIYVCVCVVDRRVGVKPEAEREKHWELIRVNTLPPHKHTLHKYTNNILLLVNVGMLNVLSAFAHLSGNSLISSVKCEL